MAFWPAGRQFTPTHLGCYEPVEVRRLLHTRDNLHVTEQLHKASIRGCAYPESLRLHVQSSHIPNQPYWSIVGRHDMFCGVFNRDGDKFFSGSHDGVVRIFDSSARYFRLLTEIECPTHFWSIVSLSLSPNERQMVYSVLSERIHLATFEDSWENPRNTIIDAGLPDEGDTLRDPLAVAKTFAVCFDGSGTQILASHNSGIVQIFDIGNGSCVQRNYHCQEGYRDVNALTTIDPFGNVFLAGSDDTNIRLFDLRALNEGALAVFAGHLDGITYLDSKGDGTYFLSNSKDQRVKLWDLRKHTKPGKERRASRISWDYRYHPIPNTYFHPDSKRSTRGDQSVLTMRGHAVRFSLIRVRFSPAHSTGQRFAYAGSAFGAWPVWDLFTGKLVQTSSTGSHAIRDVHWHPWDSVAVSSGMDGSLTCWTHEDAQSDTQGGQSICAEDLRAQLSAVDPDGELYERPLARSGLRYRFLGEGTYGLSPPSSESSYYEVIRYVTDANLDDDDTAFLTMSDSSDTQSEFGLPLSEFSDEDVDVDEDFYPNPYDLIDLQIDFGLPERRPITRSQTRGRPRLRQQARRAAANQSTADRRGSHDGTSRQRPTAGPSRRSTRSQTAAEPQRKRRRGR